MSETILLDPTEIYLSRDVRFWLLLPFNIISVICTFFQIYCLLTKRALRTALNNHSIIAIHFSTLSSLLIDIPFYITYTRIGYIWFPTPFFCRFWTYVNIAGYEVTIFLIMWASLERHILIFHERWLLISKKRWLLHYIPLIFFIIYPLLFYLLIFIFGPCDDLSSFDYTQPWCNYTPYCYDNMYLPQYDVLANWFSCIMITFLSDIVLIIRVLWQRRIRLHQPIRWRRHRKMVIQLLSVSIFASSFSTPSLIYCVLLYFGYLTEDIDPQLEICLLYFVLFSILFLPFIMILSLPKEYWWGKVKNILCNRQQIRVAPAVPVPRILNPLPPINN